MIENIVYELCKDFEYLEMALVFINPLLVLFITYIMARILGFILEKINMPFIKGLFGVI